MITNHIQFAPFTLDAIASRTPYVRGHEIRWQDAHRHKYGSAMAEYLDLCEGEDEATGDVDWTGHYRRFGKRILVCNDQGFVDVWRYASEDEAIGEFAAIDLDYCRYEDEDDEGEDDEALVGATENLWCDVHEAFHEAGGFVCELATSENLTKSTLADVRALNRFQLARLADLTSDPDSPESAGTKFLARVRDAIVEGAHERLVDEQGCIVDDDEATDFVHEIADEAPSIYTHEVWAQFVDLCAYHEDLEGYVDESTDMESRARVALYLIAERLALALVDEVRDLDELGE